MRTLSAACIVLVTLWTPWSAAQLGPMYKLVQVTNNPHFEYFPRINNLGQVVYAGRMGGTWDMESEEIFLYDHGTLTQITNDNVRDAFPDINDAGTIVWSRFIGPDGPYGPTAEIVKLENGVLTQLTDNAADDRGAKINNRDHIVWYRYMGYASCGPQTMDLFYWDGQSESRLTFDGEGSDGVSYQQPWINDWDDIVCTRFDDCVENWQEWTSKIILLTHGQVVELDTVDFPQSQGPCVNNACQVVWGYRSGWGQSGVACWQNATTWWLTQWGGHPRINDRGDIAFDRWYDDGQMYNLWFWRAGRFYRLTDDPYDNLNPAINSAGEVVWSSGNFPTTDVRLLQLKGPEANGQGRAPAPGQARRVDP